MTTAVTAPAGPAPTEQVAPDEPSAPRIPRALAYALESLAIVVVYLALGDLNRQFTPPPMGISPIWLPAGFALGVVLNRGWWTLAPLFATGIIATLRTDLSLTTPVEQGGYGLATSTLAWAALLVALAVVAHVALARLLIERVLGDSPLDGIGSALAFLLFAGPVSCVASALIGTEVFRVEGFLAPGTFAVNAFTFWIGDSIACMLLAPVFVAVLGGPRWRGRRLPIAALAVAATLLLLATTWLVGSAELHRVRESFDRSTSIGANVFEQRMDRLETAALDLAAVATATHPISERTFVKVVTERRDRLPAAELISWIETPGGDIGSARVVHAEGIGADDLEASWVSAPIARQLEFARDTGRTVWVPEADDPGAIHDFIYAPMLSPELGASPRRQLLGFIAVRTDVQAALEEIVSDLNDRHALVVVIGRQAGHEAVVLAASPGPARNPLVDESMSPQAVARSEGVPFATEHAFGIGGSRWTATFAPSRQFLSEESFLIAILPGSLMAMLLTLTLGVLALSSTGQRERLARLVRQRTGALRRTEHRYRSVVDNVREAIFQLDAEDVITFASRAWDARPNAGGAESVVGRSLTDALQVGDSDRLTALARAAREQPGVPVRGEFETADQDLLEVRMIAPTAPIASATDAVDDPLEPSLDAGAVVGMVVDMTEQRAVLRNRERFVSLVAHELRNPLTVISGSVATISNHEQDELPPLAARLLPAVQLSARKLDRIITDLLTSSQVDAGTLRLVEEPTDLREVVERTIEAATISAQENGIELVDEVPDEPLEATCDVDRVTQVLDNLLSNAIKYTPAGGVIRVRAEQGGNEDIRISIADTGIGIAPADHRTIFERYGRTDLGTTVATGTGLGLAICLAIAEAHGGTIQVESEVGEGSTFVFVLPATPQADPGA